MSCRRSIAAFLAFFTTAIWCRLFMSRIFYPCNFYGASFSCSAFSLAQFDRNIDRTVVPNGIMPSPAKTAPWWSTLTKSHNACSYCPPSSIIQTCNLGLRSIKISNITDVCSNGNSARLNSAQPPATRRRSVLLWAPIFCINVFNLPSVCCFHS